MVFPDKPNTIRDIILEWRKRVIFQPTLVKIKSFLLKFSKNWHTKWHSRLTVRTCFARTKIIKMIDPLTLYWNWSNRNLIKTVQLLCYNFKKKFKVDYIYKISLGTSSLRIEVLLHQFEINLGSTKKDSNIKVSVKPCWKKVCFYQN
jgi:hypothetical protein